MSAINLPGVSLIGNVSGNVQILFTAILAKYEEALAAKPEPWARTLSGWTSTAALRSLFPVDLTSLDGFREWVGERKIQNGELTSFYIDSKPWERSIEIDVNLARSGQAPPVYVNKVPHLVRAAAVHPNRLLANLLANGSTNKVQGFDGKFLDGTDRPLFGTHNYNPNDAGKGTYVNLQTTKPFNATNFALARKLFRSMKAPDGKTSLGLQLTHILAPTDLEETLNGFFDVQYDVATVTNKAGSENVAAAMKTNQYFGALPKERRIIAPELDGEPGVWYGLALNTGLTPFEAQFKDDGNPEIVIMGEGSEYCAMQDKVAFLGKLFGNVGAALPFTIIRFEPS